MLEAGEAEAEVLAAVAVVVEISNSERKRESPSRSSRKRSSSLIACRVGGSLRETHVRLLWVRGFTVWGSGTDSRVQQQSSQQWSSYLYGF